MLGMICVPGILPPPTEGSELGAGAADAAEIEPAEGRPDGGGGAPGTESYAPRRESTLLTASGDTCGAAFGSPMPCAVVASSGGTDCGGGP